MIHSHSSIAATNPSAKPPALIAATAIAAAEASEVTLALTPLCERCENQWTRLLLSEVDALDQELAHRLSMDTPPHPSLGYDATISTRLGTRSALHIRPLRFRVLVVSRNIVNAAA
jgi:hypothetical protein